MIDFFLISFYLKSSQYLCFRKRLEKKKKEKLRIQQEEERKREAEEQKKRADQEYKEYLQKRKQVFSIFTHLIISQDQLIFFR